MAMMGRTIVRKTTMMMIRRRNMLLMPKIKMIMTSKIKIFSPDLCCGAAKERNIG